MKIMLRRNNIYKIINESIKGHYIYIYIMTFNAFINYFINIVPSEHYFHEFILTDIYFTLFVQELAKI